MTPLPVQPTVAFTVSVRPASHRERGPRGRPRRAVEVPESQTLLLASCVTLGRWIPSLCSLSPVHKTGQIWQILELKVCSLASQGQIPSYVEFQLFHFPVG